MIAFKSGRVRLTGFSAALLLLTVGQQLANANGNLVGGLAPYEPLNRLANPVFGNSLAGGLLTGATTGLNAVTGLGASANPVNGMGGLVGGLTGGLLGGVGELTGGIGTGVGNVITGVTSGVLGGAGAAGGAALAGVGGAAAANQGLRPGLLGLMPGAGFANPALNVAGAVTGAAAATAGAATNGTLLPDVWLNGLPVNYKNLPLRALQYGPGGPYFGNWPNGFGGWSSFAYGGAGPLSFDQIQSVGEAGGFLVNGQPFWASNAFPMNALVMDPMNAYLASGPVFGSSVYPILANGQLEAMDETSAANLLTLMQQNGAGMLSTYFGFGRMNPVPLLTGTASEVNLTPTTTIGTTYPIGSALVIEPRDSYFQDYIDSASSRQNYDEREQ